jgi:hypothetical protein
LLQTFGASARGRQAPLVPPGLPQEFFIRATALERRWIETLLQNVLNRLRDEYAKRGQGALFQGLQDYQPHDPAGPSYAQLGEQLGLSEAAVKSAVKRMRQRHSELLRAEIAQTVTRRKEVEEELRYFRTLLSKGPN